MIPVASFSGCVVKNTIPTVAPATQPAHRKQNIKNTKIKIDIGKQPIAPIIPTSNGLKY